MPGRKFERYRRSSLLAPITALILSGSLVGQPSPSFAQSARASAHSVAGLDDALVQARQAFINNDANRFEIAASRASSHELADYLDFWRLRMRLRRGNPEAATGLVDPDVREFIAGRPDAVLADQLRRDWMLDLARRGEWHLFEQQYADWISRDDGQVHCYAQLGRVERGEAAPEALATARAVRDLGEGCGSLVAALQSSQRISAQQLRTLWIEGLEANSRDTVERIGMLMGIERSTIGPAWTRPQRIKLDAVSRDVALVALARGAREKPDWAALQLERGVKSLRPVDVDFAWSLVAAAGMRELAPQALFWTRKALKAKPGDETLQWMTRAALREHDWKTVRTLIGKMSEEGRREPTWVYWHARAMAAAGQQDGAQALLRTIAGQYHFYGQLASEELGEPLRAVSTAAPTSSTDLALAGTRPGFQRALRLYEAGLRVEGNREWNHQLRGMSDRDLVASAAWACQRGVLDRCVNTAERTRDEHDFALRFVTPFLDELKPVAASRGLDPAWIYGLIRQESRFLMDARSSAGAQGLMQIMPNTGRWIANKLGVEDFHVRQLNELPVNLEFGTFYLRTVLDDLDGSPLLASAGYNAGPRRPMRWRASLPGPVEGAIFAEIIPFAETRDYVKKVLSNAAIYGERFSGNPQSLKAMLGTITPPPAAVTAAR